MLILFWNLDCHFGCQQCSGPRNGECSTCLPGYFRLSNSTGEYCFLVCPYEYKPDHSSYQCVTKVSDIPEAVLKIVVAASPVTSISFLIANAISGSFPLHMMMCRIATESLANMQYLNINHSKIASDIYPAMASSYIPNWIASFNDLDPEQLIFPFGIFQTNQISSLFLDNFGGILTETMLRLGAFLLIASATSSMGIEKLRHSMMGRLHVTMFSFFASSLFGKFQSLLLYSVLQILKPDLFLDNYSNISYFTGCLALLLTIVLFVICFFRMLSIFNNKHNHKKNSSRTISIESSSSMRNKMRWLKKKYEFLFVDFKKSQKKHFFFAFWITAFNAIYILLIISLQNISVLQCILVVILVLSFIIFPAITNPFENQITAFLHFFNFSCILLAAILNSALAIIQIRNPDFSGVEMQGKAVISIIAMNTGTNTIISLSQMIIVISQKLKNSGKDAEMRKEKYSNKRVFHSTSGKTHKDLSPKREREKRYLRNLRSIEKNEQRNNKKISAADISANDPFNLNFLEIGFPIPQNDPAKRTIWLE